MILKCRLLIYYSNKLGSEKTDQSANNLSLKGL